MKTSLFRSGGKFYKCCLHTHSSVSDGDLSPEEVKKAYMAKGYSAGAFSDHEVLVPHEDLLDETFVPLTAIELEFVDTWTKAPFSVLPVYHIVCIASRINETYYPWATRSMTWGNAVNYLQDYCQGEHSRYPDYRNVNYAAADAEEHGFLVTYCHPGWSINHYPDYCNLEHIHFIEVCNGGYYTGRSTDFTDHHFEDFLSLGKPCAPTFSDDGHHLEDVGFGATYVKADALTYPAIFDALKKGDCYGSNGPTFEDIAFDPETGILTVDCEGAEVVSVTTDVRNKWSKGRRFTGSVVTNAEFDLSKYIRTAREQGLLDKAYFRVNLFSADGRVAYSRGYFLKEFFPEEAKAEA